MRRTVDINVIKENPLAKELFGDLPEGEFVLLKQDIKDRGVQIPIEVTPDYTMVDGHLRLEAQKALGAKEVEVVVREDLIGEEAVENHLIKNNVHRRHLSAEQKLGAVKYLSKKLSRSKGRPRKGVQVAPFLEGKGKTREKIAKLVGISKRSVDKYLKLEKVPESKKQKAVGKESRFGEALEKDIGKEIVSASSLEETGQGVWGKIGFGEGLMGEFDPVGEAGVKMGEECVRCGEPAYVPVAGDGPVWFVCRLVTEFVKEPQKALCHECLCRFYEDLGLYVQKNWKQILNRTPL